MKQHVTVGKIIGTIICSLVIIGGIVVIAINFNAETAFPVIGGILLSSFGGGCLLSIWFPLSGGAATSHYTTETPEERAERKAQKRAARDMAIAAFLVDSELRSRKKKDKKENVWEDNSEDNDDADPDNW